MVLTMGCSIKIIYSSNHGTMLNLKTGTKRLEIWYNKLKRVKLTAIWARIAQLMLHWKTSRVSMLSWLLIALLLKPHQKHSLKSLRWALLISTLSRKMEFTWSNNLKNFKLHRSREPNNPLKGEVSLQKYQQLSLKYNHFQMQLRLFQLQIQIH